MIRIDRRDIAILTDLLESRVMTSAHITRLHFDGRSESSKKRLQALKKAGLVSERERNILEPAVRFLSRKGFHLLQEAGVLEKYPPLSLPALVRRSQVGKATILHELEIMDVKVAFHEALRRSERHSLHRFSTWPALYQFEAQPYGMNRDILVKPDGFIRIGDKDGTENFGQAFFLEVDRSTEVQDILISRASGYLAFFRSGGFALRNGASPSSFKDFPFRVLFVLKTAERRNNTAERLLHSTPPILNLVWLTTLKEVTSDPLGRIWIRPADYQAAVKGTAYERPIRSRVYRHQTERDALVERRIRKARLLG